jgi:hypothetical protein
MDPQNICVGGRLWRQKIIRRGNAIGKQLVVNQTIFLRWKNVRAQIQIVSLIVHELEWHHDGQDYREVFQNSNASNRRHLCRSTPRLTFLWEKVLKRITGFVDGFEPGGPRG